MLRPLARRAQYVAAGSCAILVLPMGAFGTLLRHDVSGLPPVRIFIVAITSLLGLLLLSRAVYARYRLSIRWRLIVALVSMALLPAIALATVSTVVGYRSGRQQVIDQLESVATIKEAELNTWVRNVQTDLSAVVIGDDATKYMGQILSPSVDPVVYQVAYEQLHERFGRMVAQSPRLDQLFVMGLDRRVVLSTDYRQEGGFAPLGSQSYFHEGLKGEYLHPPSYTLSIGGVAVVAVCPIADEQGQVVGILAGLGSLAGVSDIMLERTGLGKTGETYLVTGSHVMLTEPRVRQQRWSQVYYVFSEGAKVALREQANGSSVYENYRHERVIGVYRWLPELHVALLAEQAESEAMSAVYTTLAINAGVAVVAILVAGVAALVLARTIADPLANLVSTAERVAGGELEHTAKVGWDDEIGALARAFNTMTARLRELIGSLERQVEERTRALQRRALQLETSTRVSREITSILDIDVLLSQVVELIKEAFGYYYVGVFLVDTQTRDLVFAAGTGEAGQRWKREGLTLDTGMAGVNGEVVQACRAVMVNDISQDRRYMASEDLLETRAELAIPLRIGERVVGTIDVQSAEVNAFSEDDMGIMQSLGDQIAVAIENVRLYDRSQDAAVLEERNRLARELHDSVTQLLYSLVLLAGAASKIVDDGEQMLRKQHLVRIEETAQQALKEMRLLVYELRPLPLEDEGLVGALNQRLDAVERRAGIQARLTAKGDLDLPATVEEEVYRVVHEALNNALKHSGAGSVSVNLLADGEWFQAEVVDDGRGFDVPSTASGGGVGLASMRERAEALGGSVILVSEPGEGTKVLLRVRPDAGARRRSSVGVDR